MKLSCLLLIQRNKQINLRKKHDHGEDCRTLYKINFKNGFTSIFGRLKFLSLLWRDIRQVLLLTHGGGSVITFEGGVGPFLHAVLGFLG